MHAGHEGIAALDAMDEGVVAQELQRPINRDRRRPWPLRGQPLHDLIGAERLMTAEQDVQHLPADRGEAAALLEALRLRDRHGLAAAAAMIMIGTRKHLRGRSAAA